MAAELNSPGPGPHIKKGEEHKLGRRNQTQLDHIGAELRIG
jgi:hypothetical protein